MTTRKLAVAGLGLAVCMGWALSSTLADPAQATKLSYQSLNPAAIEPAVDMAARAVPPQPSLARATDSAFDDPAYLAAFHMAPVDALIPDAPAPSTEQSEVRRIDSDDARLQYGIIENPVWASEEDRMHALPDNGLRSDPPCVNVAYRNRPGTYITYFPFARVAGVSWADDCTLPVGTQYPFICAVTVTTFGARTGGADYYDLTISLWDQCPEEPGAVEVGRGTFINLPNDSLFRSQTVQINPSYRDPTDTTLWVRYESHNADAALILGQDTVQHYPGSDDVGSTQNLMGQLDGNPGCNLLRFADPLTAFTGFDITIRGTAGPLGSCCDLSDGSCAIDRTYGSCSQLTQVWNEVNSCPPPGGCTQCQVSTCSPGSALENEPDVATNYVDTTNAGCFSQNNNFYTQYFTPVLCNTSGCGRSGNYTFLNGTLFENRRDEDWYVLTLTRGQGDKLVTLSASGQFPIQATVGFTLRQTNHLAGLRCPLSASTVETDEPVVTATTCQTATAFAVCAAPRTDAEPPLLRYVLRVRPVLLEGITPGASYSWSVTCEDPGSPLATGACCTPSGCTETTSLACVLEQNQYQGDGVSCGSVSCPGVPPNDDCRNRVVLTANAIPAGASLFDNGWIVSFDNTFANTETITAGQAGTVFNDVWYKFWIPENVPGTIATGAFNGRSQGKIAATTIGSCFNSKIVLYKVANNNGNGAQQCVSPTGMQQQKFGDPFVKSTDLVPINLSKFAYCVPETPGRPGEQWIARIGGNTAFDFGPGQFRLDWIPQGPTNAPGWNATGGRCCFSTGHCTLATRQCPSCTLDDCIDLGGYMRNTTDFWSGSGGQTIVEVTAVGCNTVPCPQPGEACFNALDLNALLSGGGGFGTVTRRAINTMYFKYVVPSLATGSGLTFETCTATNYDSAITLFRNLDTISGECIEQTPINSFFATNDDCGPAQTTAASAQGIAECYAPFQSPSCKCLKIVAGSPNLNEVRAGDTIYIGVGRSPTNPISSPRKMIDISQAAVVPGELSCRQVEGDQSPLVPRTLGLGVRATSTCFQCTVTCPGGTTPENEPGCGIGYTDLTNGGCSAATPSQQFFLPIACGQTYCGASGTFRVDRPCLIDEDCVNNETCSGVPGTCQNTDDNTRDSDWYRINVASPSHLTWSVTAYFPAALQIVSSPLDVGAGTDCVHTTVVAQQTNAVQCDTTTIGADVCAGTYYLLVEPTNETGSTCGGQVYYANLTCSASGVSATGCCKGDMNNDGVVNSRDIRPWMNELFFPASGVAPASGCFDLGTCRGDFSNDYAIKIADDLSPFVSALLATNTCSPTTFGDANGCQLVTSDDTGVISDMSSTLTGGKYRCADDFKVTNTSTSTLSEVDWWGFYVDYSVVGPCTPPEGNGDSFKITIYNDNLVDATLNIHVPGTVRSGPQVVTPVRTVDVGGTVLYLGSTFQRYKYVATLPVSVSVASGGMYWIEIVNESTGCLWHWSTSHVGNGASVQKSSATPAGTDDWNIFDHLPLPPDPANQLNEVPSPDFAFCLPGLRLDSKATGMPKGRCCLYPSFICSVQTQLDCELALGGVWGVAVDCSNGCPSLPQNDNCANATVITRNPLYSGSIILATKDGPAMSCESNCAPICNSASDIWFQWRADFDGKPQFTTCDTLDPNFRYDQMLVVYNACPSLGGTQLLGGCNDDGCGASGPSRIQSADVTCGNTYWIRCSGWKGSKGNLMLRVVWPGHLENDPGVCP